MKRTISKATKFGYGKLLKPVLFRSSPDKVHASMIRMARGVQRVPLVRDVLRGWAYKNEPYLAQNLFGIDFKNPVGLAAGLDKNADTVGVMQAVGFGFMTAGSVTAEACAGNPKPWFHRLPKTKSLVVYVGLANRGASNVAKRIDRYPVKLFKHFPLVVSAAKTNSKEASTEAVAIADYCTTLTTMSRLKAVKMLEVNISCPNTYGGEPFTTVERLEKLLTAVDKLKLAKPVIVKMPISLAWSETSRLLDVIVKHNIQAVAIGNLLKDRSKANLKDNLPDSVKGNLSGLPTQAISNDLIRKTYRKYGQKLVIIGIGGIFSADDAYAKIRAGASLVALVTGLIFEGPQLVGDINRGLVKRLRADGFTNVVEAVGAEHRNS